MAVPFRTVVHFERSYEPTQIQAGQVTDTAFRSENLWYRDNGRVENFLGVFDTGLTAPLQLKTGTVTISTGSPVVTGTGTIFTQELQRTCFVLIDGDIYSVRDFGAQVGFTDDTSMFIDPPAQASGTFPYYLCQI